MIKTMESSPAVKFCGIQHFRLKMEKPMIENHFVIFLFKMVLKTGLENTI
jgi:hypothetical protein